MAISGAKMTKEMLLLWHKFDRERFCVPYCSKTKTAYNKLNKIKQLSLDFITDYTDPISITYET